MHRKEFPEANHPATLPQVGWPLQPPMINASYSQAVSCSADVACPYPRFTEAVA